MKFSTPTTAACLFFGVALVFYLASGNAPIHEARLKTAASAPGTPAIAPGLSSPLAATEPTHPGAFSQDSGAAAPPTALRHGAPFPGTPPQIAFSSGPLGWELQLKEARDKAGDGASAASAILRMLSYLPEEALETAVEQALEKLPDNAWAATAGPFLANPVSHVRVLSVLFADLMERPQAVSLPALAGLAKDPSHPFASFAFDNLRLFLGEDLKLADLSSDAPIAPKENANPPAPNPEAPQ
jgi:hypothetical protein